ncbi:MAG: BMP family ABC transporter substrate-binding protein, partial [Chloroflexota bacterium]
VDDHGLNQLAWEGVQQALGEDLIDRADAIETIDSRDRAKNIAAFAEAGYDLIVTVSFAMGDDTRFAADNWPDTRFIGIDQPPEVNEEEGEPKPRPNLALLTFPEDQGGFLAGVLAAETTQTQKIGALCEEESIPEAWRYCEGFRAGVFYVNPDLRPRVVYHPSHNPDDWFNDPAWGEEQIPAMQTFGADVLFAAGGATALGALQAAAAQGIRVIGADEDMFYQAEAQDFVLSSAVKRADLGVYDLIRLAVAGTFPGGEFTGQYALASFHSLERWVLPSVRPRLDIVQRGLADGSLETGAPREP